MAMAVVNQLNHHEQILLVQIQKQLVELFKNSECNISEFVKVELDTIELNSFNSYL